MSLVGAGVIVWEEAKMPKENAVYKQATTNPFLIQPLPITGIEPGSQKREARSECIVHCTICSMCTPFYYYMYIKSVRKQHLIQLFSGGYVDREIFDYGEF